MTLGTECAKCGAAMPMLAQAAGGAPIERAHMTITGYLCPKCDHWNNLKRRAWWKEQHPK